MILGLARGQAVLDIEALLAASFRQSQAQNELPALRQRIAALQVRPWWPIDAVAGTAHKHQAVRQHRPPRQVFAVSFAALQSCSSCLHSSPEQAAFDLIRKPACQLSACKGSGVPRHTASADPQPAWPLHYQIQSGGHLTPMTCRRKQRPLQCHSRKRWRGSRPCWPQGPF